MSYWCKPIEKVAIVMDFLPEKLTEDCSLSEVYGKESNQRPEDQTVFWKPQSQNL